MRWFMGDASATTSSQVRPLQLIMKTWGSLSQVSKPKEMWQPRKSGEPLQLKRCSAGASMGQESRPPLRSS